MVECNCFNLSRGMGRFVALFIVFKRYTHSFLATCISVVSTLFYVLGGFIAIGYILDKGYDFSHYEHGSPLNDR